MDDLFHEIEEDLRHDNIIKFFKKYGNYIIAGVLVIALGGSSYLYWQHYKYEKNAKESQAYDRALFALAANKTQEALEQLKAISANQDTYASFAALRQAAILLEVPDNQILSPAKRAEAVQIYSILAQNQKLDMRIRHLAILLQVMAAIDEEEPKKLLDLLGGISVGANPWMPLVSEMTAFLTYKSGDLKQAEQLYQALLKDEQLSETIRLRAQAMLSQINTMGKP